MKKNWTKFLVLVLLFSILSLGFQVSKTSAQAVDTRTGSYTTDRGTSVSIETDLTHEGGSPPLLETNREYLLIINITLTKLGNDTQDIHDFEFDISMTTDSLLGLGDEKQIFNSYYFDPDIALSEANTSEVYEFPIFITGDLGDTSANLDIIFKSKEAVENRLDPTTEFDGIGYNLDILSTEEGDEVTFGGNTSEVRSTDPLTAEDTKVSISVNLTHDGLSEGKPTLSSGNFYKVIANITLLELGTDARDIHDLRVQAIMKDSSITDVIPGSEAVDYFSAYGENATELTDAGQSIIFEFVLQPNTNINDTEVNLTFTFQFAEDIENSIDPDSEYSINFEIFINQDFEGLSSQEDESPANLVPSLLLFFVLIPVYRSMTKQ